MTGHSGFIPSLDIYGVPTVSGSTHKSLPRLRTQSSGGFCILFLWVAGNCGPPRLTCEAKSSSRKQEGSWALRPWEPPSLSFLTLARRFLLQGLCTYCSLSSERLSPLGSCSPFRPLPHEPMRLRAGQSAGTMSVFFTRLGT